MMNVHASRPFLAPDRCILGGACVVTPHRLASITGGHVPRSQDQDQTSFLAVFHGVDYAPYANVRDTYLCQYTSMSIVAPDRSRF
jgi:hypothetical protein